MRVDDGGDSIGVSWKPLTNSSPERSVARCRAKRTRRSQGPRRRFYFRGDAHCRVEQVDRRNDDDMIGVAVCGLSSICQSTAAMTSDIQPTERRPVPYVASPDQLDIFRFDEILSHNSLKNSLIIEEAANSFGRLRVLLPVSVAESPDDEFAQCSTCVQFHRCGNDALGY